jgi:tRNA nucleotidyltransferase (CCA-adding enzyme)
MLKDAQEILTVLNNNNCEAYIVGGFVRDFLLKRPPKDVDITTSATLDDLKRFFPSADFRYGNYNVAIIKRGELEFFITSYRKEGKYIKARKPKKVKAIKDLKKDLLRRDFTINSLVMDKDGNIYDMLGAKEDLERKIIRTIGNPKKKFRQDALRMLRAIRFATTLDFEIEKRTKKAIVNKGKLIKKISFERKKGELDKIFQQRRGIDLLIETNLYKYLPGFKLEILKNIKQTSYPIGVWAQLNISDEEYKKWTLTNQEIKIIKMINNLVKRTTITEYEMYLNGLDVSIIAGEILGFDPIEINDKYNSLPIHSRKDINITPEKIMQLVERGPGEWIDKLYKDIEFDIIYTNVRNDEEALSEYVINYYK